MNPESVDSGFTFNYDYHPAGNILGIYSYDDAFDELPGDINVFLAIRYFGFVGPDCFVFFKLLT